MKLTKIYTAAGQLEAEMIKGFLEAQDIHVVLNQESVGRTMGLSAGRLGQVQVLVSDTHFEEAKALLDDLAAGKFEGFEDKDLPK